MRPDPLEGREAPKDLRFIIAALLGCFLIVTGGIVLWNVIDGATFAGNVGRQMDYAERIVVSGGIIVIGATLLRFAVRGAQRLAREDKASN